jgi:tetratricopeptide (TPR) repeat protein
MISVVTLLRTRRRVGRHVAGATLVLLCGALSLTNARAQEQTDLRPAQQSPPKAAVDHYSRGRAHYQAGRYREAVAELEQALALDPSSPNLVYNLARVYELLGNIDQAIAHYERYRAMLPADEAAERERVGVAIQRLTGARAQLATAPKQPVVRSERGVADTAFWTLASASFAALATGGITGGLAVRAEREARGFVLGRDGDGEALELRAQRADRLAAASDATIALGAVGGLTSILLYALRSRPVVMPSIAWAPHGLCVTVRGAL